MGVLKKFRGGYSHEAAQASNSSSSAVPAYKDTNGVSRTTIGVQNSYGTCCVPYAKLVPVCISKGLYESVDGETYDNSKIYYTKNGDIFTEVDLSSIYTNGDTISGEYYVCTYDVEDYSISDDVSGGSQSTSQTFANTNKKRCQIFTITIANNTENDIVVKAVKFYNDVSINGEGGHTNILKLCYYFDPSEYITIAPGGTDVVLVALNFGQLS